MHIDILYKLKSGFKMRIGPPCPQRVVKGDFMGLFLGITLKRVAPCQYLNGHDKEPYDMSRWEPDRSFNFFNPPAYLCCVTYEGCPKSS